MDDFTALKISLTNEFVFLKKHVDITPEMMGYVGNMAIDEAFTTDEVKEKLREKIKISLKSVK